MAQISVPRILLVDDDPDFRRLMRVMLETARYDVDEAVNGLRLISKLKVRLPDVILLDIFMSWGNGLDLCQSIKQNRHFGQVPICLISGRRVTEGEIAQALDRGASAYFRKPVEWAALLKTLDRLVGRTQGAALCPAAPLY